MIRVYALVDPRTGSIRYVGITSSSLVVRKRGHLAEARKLGGSCHRLAWLRQLLAVNLQPDIWLLEETDDKDQERVWIQKLRAAGCDLTNSTTVGERSEHSKETREKLRIIALNRGPEHIAKIQAALEPQREEIGRKISASKQGHLVSEETRQKLKTALIGRAPSRETIEKQSEARRGKKRKPHSAESRQKMSEARRGKKRGPRSQEVRERISLALKGIKRSEEVRQKMSASRRGVKRGPCSPEAKRRISEALKGVKCSEESRRKMSEAKIGCSLSEETRRKIGCGVRRFHEERRRVIGTGGTP